MANESKEVKPIISGTFTANELASIIQQFADSNRDSLKEFASELAFKLAHPEPTEKERLARQAAMRERAEQARDEDAKKEHKRLHCVSPASPHAPHRRSGAQWGMFNGTSVIAWAFSMRTTKDPVTGVKGEVGPIAIGVCQWCGTEFSPERPGYAEALSWGLNASVGTYHMDIHTGTWI